MRSSWISTTTGWNEMRVWSPRPDDAGIRRPPGGGRHRRAARSAATGAGRELRTSGRPNLVENVFDVNRRIYGFRLVGVEDPTQVLCYRSGSDDEYVAHTDIGPVTSLRKLSFSLLLSDPATFEGGDLDFGTPFALARLGDAHDLPQLPAALRHPSDEWGPLRYSWALRSAPRSAESG